ncbi:MAG: hydrogenase maturation protease [Candidatus Saccharicenans sp.]
MAENWQASLSKGLADLERLVVLGTGNALKADDAAGLLVVSLLDHHLTRRQKSKVKVLRAYEIIDAYLKKIKNLKPSHLIIVDAINLGKKPGTIIATKIEPEKKRRKKAGGEFYSFLDKLSTETACQIYFLGIQPETLDFGHPITSSVKEAAKKIADFISRLASGKVN